MTVLFFIIAAVYLHIFLLSIIISLKQPVHCSLPLRILLHEELCQKSQEIIRNWLLWKLSSVLNCLVLEHLTSENRRTFLNIEQKADLWACISHNDSEPDSWLREFHCSFHRILLNYKLAKMLVCTLRLTYEYALFIAFSLFPFPSRNGKWKTKEFSVRWAEIIDAINFSYMFFLVYLTTPSPFSFFLFHSIL